LIKLNNFDEALKLIDEHLEKNPDDHEAHLERAGINLKLGNYSKAIEDANKAIELHPTS
jgi:tetratricopeptide (TPR) repeat protein